MTLKDYKNKPEGYYNVKRKEMLEFLPVNSKKILEIGCGDGTFASFLKNENTVVWGIELMKDQALTAREKIDKILIGPCEENIHNLPDNYFDAIYCNDVLEHLVDPYTVIQQLKSKLSENGKLISSIPNVRYHNTFMRLILKKDWKYESFGVMDKTHLRFFTKKSIKRMYEEAGYKIEINKGINRSKSLKVILYNIPVLFLAMDIAYPQYATVVSKK
jgi:2-polyprenyl-3-methyl-5-hydroxy-6-metoxy-1,4-benzoquinol methylase